jgi:hypothetical protein
MASYAKRMYSMLKIDKRHQNNNYFSELHESATEVYPILFRSVRCI